jgi:hypothetical protein
MIGILKLLVGAAVLTLTQAEPLEAKSKMYLRLDEPRDLLVEPYKLYEVYVPLSTLKPSEAYWIRTYYIGGQASDAVMKRKSVQVKNLDVLYKETDFYRRFQATLQRGLKDHRYVMEFALDANRRFEDDPYQERYFIAQEGDEEYLLFVFSVVKVAFALDETAFYDKIRLTMELRANKLEAFSRLKNYPATIALNVVMLIVFMSVMYLLFPSLRATAFGLFTRSS